MGEAFIYQHHLRHTSNDGRYQAVADEGENGFTAEKGETFLQSVYTPVITPTP